MQGTITFSSERGWYFAEKDADHGAIFVHQNQVENQRYLKVGDRIEFEIGPSTKNPGKIQALNVRYLGHTIARQIGERP
jgi:cold shock CspA family protein